MAQQNDSGKVETQEPPAKPSDQHVTTDDTENHLAANSDNTADPANPAAANQDDSAASNRQSGKSKPRDRAAERRISKLSGQLKEEKAARAQDRTRIAELEQQIESLKAGQADNDPKKPELKDFDTPEEYAEAHSKWKAGQSEEPPKKKDPPAAAEPDDQTGVTAPDTEIQSFITKGSAKLGDQFLEAMDDSQNHAVSQTMGDFMLDSEFGPEIYTHLAHRQDLALKIYRRGPESAREHMAELEKQAKAGKLDLEPPEASDTDDEPPKKDDPPKDPPPRSTSKAPDPPKDQGRDDDAPPAKNPESESMDEYAARRQKEINAGAGGGYITS